jgi:hypothetical protein
MAGSGVSASHATVSIQGKPLAGARSAGRDVGHVGLGIACPRDGGLAEDILTDPVQRVAEQDPVFGLDR